MAFKIILSTKRRHCQKGGTLVEYLVSMGVGTLSVMLLASLFLYCTRSFINLSNYVDLNSSSMRTLDQVSRDIRQSAALSSYTSNRLVFSDGTNANALSYTYDPAARTLVRQQGSSSKTLLTECDALEFAIYQRTPLAGTYDQYPTATATNCKVVSVKWSCSRSIMGRKANTETVQEAKIVLRRR
jgi:Tfp pilus assembly protein PilW